jgi:hypothetical protein
MIPVLPWRQRILPAFYHYRLMICGLLLTILFVVCFPYWPEIEHVLLPRTLQQLVGEPTWGCGDSACAAILVRAYPISLSARERTEGITERLCVGYTRVRKHRGYMAPYFRWAYQTGRRVRYIVQKRDGTYERVWDDRQTPDAFYVSFCPL